MSCYNLFVLLTSIITQASDFDADYAINSTRYTCLGMQRVISLFGLVFRSAFRSVLNSYVFFVWSQRLAERLAETELRTERSLNPKLINSPVDFACTR